MEGVDGRLFAVGRDMFSVLRLHGKSGSGTKLRGLIGSAELPRGRIFFCPIHYIYATLML